MVLSLDYGTKRVGVAISDDTERIAFATTPILYTKEEQLFSLLTQLFNKYKPSTVILGLPLGNDDKPTQMSQKIEEFALKLKTQFLVEVTFWNEVMTSIAASQVVKKDKTGKLDSESARILLQEYLDFKNI